MRAILIDDEGLSLQYLELQCAEIQDLEVVARFQSAPEALDYLTGHKVDLVLTDIEMPGLTGLEAVRQFRALQPDLGVIFVTGYEAHALVAFALDAVAYLLKPCRQAELERAVHRAAKLLPSPVRIELRTFGPFTMLVDGTPYRFSNSKARELLAYLVDRRGSQVTLEQAALVLWEDRPYDHLVKQLYRKLTSYLNQVMKEIGADFFAASRGSCHILPERVACDYFRLLDGDPEAMQRYDGEYMSDYSWAEPTVAKLDRLTQLKDPLA